MNPVTSLTPKQLRRAADVQDRILALQRELTNLLGAPAAAPAEPKKRRMSAAGRARIAAAARARWAKVKRGSAAPAKAAPKARRKMSAAGRARLAAIARARWKAVRAAGKKAL